MTGKTKKNGTQSVMAFVPYSGGSIHGIGTVRLACREDMTIHRYVFENETGQIMFSTLDEHHTKEMLVLKKMSGRDLAGLKPKK